MVKNNILKLGKGSLIYGAGGILNKFINLLLLPIFTRYLTPEEFGVSSMLMWITFIIIPIFSFGFGASIGACYFDKADKAYRESVIWTSFTFLTISSFILAAISVLFSKQISYLAFQTDTHSYLVMISLFSACLTIISTPFPLHLQFEEKAITFVIVTTSLTLISIILSIIFVVFLKLGITGYIEAYLISSIFSCFVYLIMALKNLKLRFSQIIIRELLKQGIPLIPTFGFLFIILHANKYILQWYWGLDTLGIYSIGFNLGLVMSLFVTAFSNAWFPFFMSFIDKQDEAKKIFSKVLTCYVFGFGSLTLTFFIFAKPVVMVMTQSSYHNAYLAVGLVASSSFFTGLFNIFLPAVYYSKKLKSITLVQGVTSLITICLSFAIIPSLGILGTAISLTAGSFCLAVLMYAGNKINHFPFKVAYEWRRIWGFFLLVAACAIISIWPRNWSLLSEILLSSLLLASIPLINYLVLTSSEKQYLLLLFGRVLKSET